MLPRPAATSPRPARTTRAPMIRSRPRPGPSRAAAHLPAVTTRPSAPPRMPTGSEVSVPAINPSLADASNALVLTAVLLYALAMLCYACDFAFRKERLLAPEKEAQAQAKVPELVGAAASATTAAPDGPASTPPPPPVTAAAGRAGGTSRWPTGFW